jgi:hypothetical protein
VSGDGAPSEVLGCVAPVDDGKQKRRWRKRRERGQKGIKQYSTNLFYPPPSVFNIL